jgi:acetylornithine deacetylase/succinyl-diaminopimelate desuccinylase-like protein
MNTGVFTRGLRGVLVSSLLTSACWFTAPASAADDAKMNAEVLKHFTKMIQTDTADPPGSEKPLTDYLAEVLKAEGIPSQTFAVKGQEHRPNLVARLKGTGKKKPLLIMAHTDVVNVDPKKWKHPPFSAHREDGYIYGRGTVDDKDNLVAALMTLIDLKRRNVPLDRDVIFLAEAGEEGSTQFGIEFMVNEHLKEIESEFCIAEGGNVSREAGKVKFASVQTLEKIPRAIALKATGVAGHGSVPLKTNAIARISGAIARVADWQAPLKLNETTAAYFERLATISNPEDAARFRAVLKPESAEGKAAFQYFLEKDPYHASVLHTSLSPNIVDGGYRVNVIPSEATATVDTRVFPDEDPEWLLNEVRKVVNDPAIEVGWAPRNVRPAGTSRLNTDAFRVIEGQLKKHYQTVVLPTMSTGATDMAYLRAKGIQCYGVGVAMDKEDGPLGFGAHSDQERVLENELYRFVKFHIDTVEELSKAK